MTHHMVAVEDRVHHPRIIAVAAAAAVAVGATFATEPWCAIGVLGYILTVPGLVILDGVKHGIAWQVFIVTLIASGLAATTLVSTALTLAHLWSLTATITILAISCTAYTAGQGARRTRQGSKHSSPRAGVRHNARSCLGMLTTGYHPGRRMSTSPGSGPRGHLPTPKPKARHATRPRTKLRPQGEVKPR